MQWPGSGLGDKAKPSAAAQRHCRSPLPPELGVAPPPCPQLTHTHTPEAGPAGTCLGAAGGGHTAVAPGPEQVEGRKEPCAWGDAARSDTSAAVRPTPGGGLPAGHPAVRGRLRVSKRQIQLCRRAPSPPTVQPLPSLPPLLTPLPSQRFAPLFLLWCYPCILQKKGFFFPPPL